MTGEPEHRKHVAFFVPSLRGGGAEKVTVTLANAFARKGLKVDLLLAQAEGPYLKDALPDVRVVDFKVTRVLKSIPKLVRYLSTEKPDCLLSALNHANLAAIIARLFASFSCRLVVAEHTTPSRSRDANMRGRLVKSLIGFVYRLADGVVAVSQGVKDDLCRLGVPSSKVAVVYNPIVSAELYDKARQDCPHPWLDSDLLVVLAVGRLEPAKDFATLIRAFSLLRGTNARLIILGEGSLRSELSALVGSLGLSESVDMPGFTDNPYAYMSRAAVFAMSSRWEGLPTVLIEALACGAPVVCTDCPSGPSEILEGGKWGALVPCGDLEALASALEQKLSRKALKSENAVERVAEFSEAASVEKYLDLLSSCGD
jgi:glycosyltransferase involved in cell wall biosynthesis